MSETDTRHMARGMSIIDHNSRGGVYGMLTIAGAVSSAYRLMAERIDIVAAGWRPVRVEPPTVPRQEALSAIGHRLGEQIESRNGDPHGQIICECEVAHRAMLENVVDTLPRQLDDVRHQMRLGPHARVASAPSALQHRARAR